MTRTRENSRALWRAAVLALLAVVLGVVATLGAWALSDGSETGEVEVWRGDVASHSLVAVPSAIGRASEPERLEGGAVVWPEGVDERDSASLLQLSVRHAHGPPAVGALVSLHGSDGEPLAEGVLDERGEWRHPGLDAVATAYVRGVTATPGRLVLGVARGRYELVLPGGAQVEGLVTIDGQPPGRPFPLSILATQGVGDLPASSRSVRGATLAGEWSSAELTCYAGPDGRFVVSGLEPGQRLNIRGPGGCYRRVEALSSPVAVQAPRSDVVIGLTRAPAVTGRVVLADGRPAPDAEVSIVFHRGALRMSTEHRDLRVDAEGRFAFPIPERPRLLRQHPPISVESARAVDEVLVGELSFRLDALSDHDGAAWRQLEDQADSHSIDLGDLVLVGAGELRLRVVDPQGEPVSGAYVDCVRPPGAIRGYGETKPITDATGRLTLPRYELDSDRLLVWASGYALQELRVPAWPESLKREVVLSPATGLELHVTEDGSSSGRPTWTLELRGRAPIFDDARVAGAHDAEGSLVLGPYRRRGLTSTVSRVEEQVVVELTPHRHRSWRSAHVVRVDGLAPHRPVHARILARVDEAEGAEEEDVSGRTLWESGPLWLEPGQRLLVDVHLQD